MTTPMIDLAMLAAFFFGFCLALLIVLPMMIWREWQHGQEIAHSHKEGEGKR